MKKLIFLLSTKNKSKKQLGQEARKAIEKYQNFAKN